MIFKKVHEDEYGSSYVGVKWGPVFLIYDEKKTQEENEEEWKRLEREFIKEQKKLLNKRTIKMRKTLKRLPLA